jgi:hypothetical protein
MRSFAEIKEYGNALIIDLLLNDSQMALTFLDLAEQTRADDAIVSAATDKQLKRTTPS